MCPDNKLVHEQMMVEFHRAGENKVTICKPHGELVLFEQPKIQQTKMLVMCQRFGDLFLFGLLWQYSSVQTKYNKGRFKVMATYLQQ